MSRHSNTGISQSYDNLNTDERGSEPTFDVPSSEAAVRSDKP